jgi:hypothetical protein
VGKYINGPTAAGGEHSGQRRDQGGVPRLQRLGGQASPRAAAARPQLLAPPDVLAQRRQRLVRQVPAPGEQSVQSRKALMNNRLKGMVV